MPYRVVYDVGAEWPNVSFVAIGLLFCVIGGLFFFGHRYRLPRSAQVRRPLFAWVFFGFALVWTAIASTAIIGGHSSASRRLADGEASVVEGIVEDFVAGPRGGHGDESFTVGGVAFTYSDYRVVPGFHRTAPYGGPIRSGIHVRIHHHHGVILRLEIAEDEITASTASALDAPTAATPWIALLLAPLLVPFAMRGFAWVGGWAGLAVRHGTAEMVDGRAFVGQSVRVGPLGGYSRCVSVTVGPSSASLAPSPPFHFFHPILTFDYTKMKRVDVRTRLFQSEVAIELDDGSKLTLFGAAGDALAAAHRELRAS